MAAEDHSNDSSRADMSNVSICVRKLNHTIGELARCYGAMSVVVALTEVMGCSACATDSVERGASIRALVERMRGSQ
jgi:hypothetical protein